MPDYLAPIAQGLQMFTNAAMQQRQLAQARQEFAQRMALQQQEFGLQQQLQKANLFNEGAKEVSPGGNVPAPMPVVGSEHNTGPTASTSMNSPTSDYMPSLSFQGTTPLPADMGRVVNVGGTAFQMPSFEDQIARQTALANVGKVPIGPKLGAIYGLPEGTLVQPGHLFGYGGARVLGQPQARVESAPRVIRTAPIAMGDGNLGDLVTYDNGKSVVNPVLDVKGNVVPAPKAQRRAAPQPTAYEAYRIGAERKQQADNEKYNGALNDLLFRANGDPAKALTMLSGDAALRPYFARAYHDVKALQAKPQKPAAQDATQITMDWLRGGQPAAVSAQPSVNSNQQLPRGNGNKIDRATAQQFLAAAGNDPTKARQLAQQNGWTF